MNFDLTDEQRMLQETVQQFIDNECPTAKLREFFPDIPPSSPSAYLVKDGELAFYWPRHVIEGRDAPTVAFGFVTAFDEHCV